MNIILGGGLSGLSAGYQLTNGGRQVTIIEQGRKVGGLARTIRHGDYKFDLGGHRFLTSNRRIHNLVYDLLGEDLLKVPRTSQIYLFSKYVDYPLTPLNAFLGIGCKTTFTILLDLIRGRLAQCFSKKHMVSLEDWVVANFGRFLFEHYFKDYSEKVWGIDCRDISMDWMAQRIDGLSLTEAIKHAFSRKTDSRYKTLTDHFLYPRYGIGQLADALCSSIVKTNSVLTGTGVKEVIHENNTISSVLVRDTYGTYQLKGREYLSSIPLITLLRKMTPRPPEHVMAAVNKIGFRSLIVVTLMIDKEKVTDLSWLYLPEKEIPFGRIHEPKNWSHSMAPKGKTHLVVEYFCDRNDSLWLEDETSLVKKTSIHLMQLGFLEQDDIIDCCVKKIPYAYPKFKVNYKRHIQTITDYLDRFENLSLIGRSGRYSYLNMDHAMESGINTAREVMQKEVSLLCNSSLKNQHDLDTKEMAGPCHGLTIPAPQKHELSL